MELLTSHTVGYNERDILLAKPEELLGRDCRNVGSGKAGILLAAYSKGGILQQVAIRYEDGTEAPACPRDIELVTA